MTGHEPGQYRGAIVDREPVARLSGWRYVVHNLVAHPLLILC